MTTTTPQPSPPLRRVVDHDTGRIRGVLQPEARRIVYGEPDPSANRATLRYEAGPASGGHRTAFVIAAAQPEGG